MKKIIALTGKKGTGKTTLALFLKAIIMRCSNKIEKDSFSGNVIGTDIFQHVEDPYSIYHNQDKLDLDSYRDIEILSFASELKKISVSLLNLDSSLVYGDQECKNKFTGFCWDRFPVWIRWINSTHRKINSQKIDIDKSVTDKIKSEQELWFACYEFNATPSGLRSGSMTVREVLQVIGTDMFRQMFDDDVWVNCVKGHIERSDAKFFIIDDMRFESELNMVKNNFDHIVVNLDREIESQDSHASEKGLDDVLPHSGCNFANITSSDIGKKNDIAIQVLRSFINGKQ